MMIDKVKISISTKYYHPQKGRREVDSAEYRSTGIHDGILRICMLSGEDDILPFLLYCSLFSGWISNNLLSGGDCQGAGKCFYVPLLGISYR
jgi:hypothetical protein